MDCNVIDLVKRGHDQAAELKSSGGAVSQLISELATQLDCTVLALREMTKQRDAEHADVLAWEKTMFKACGEDGYKSVAEKFAELESKCAALAAESEERRQFILNGVEMGFIRLPDKDTRDTVTATYERCLNGIQYMPCPKCNDTGMMDSGGTQPWGEPIEIECDCVTTQISQGGAK